MQQAGEAVSFLSLEFSLTILLQSALSLRFTSDTTLTDSCNKTIQKSITKTRTTNFAKTRETNEIHPFTTLSQHLPCLYIYRHLVCDIIQQNTVASNIGRTACISIQNKVFPPGGIEEQVMFSLLVALFRALLL